MHAWLAVGCLRFVENDRHQISDGHLQFARGPIVQHDFLFRQEDRFAPLVDERSERTRGINPTKSRIGNRLVAGRDSVGQIGDDRLHAGRSEFFPGDLHDMPIEYQVVELEPTCTPIRKSASLAST